MVVLRHVRGLRHSVRGDHLRARNRAALPGRSSDRRGGPERSPVTTINPGFGRLLAGAGGALLIVSLFMPWADSLDGASRNGWELLRTTDVLLVIVGALGIAAAITGGRFGFFRPDLSLNATADILGVVA